MGGASRRVAVRRSLRRRPVFRPGETYSWFLLRLKPRPRVNPLAVAESLLQLGQEQRPRLAFFDAEHARRQWVVDQHGGLPVLLRPADYQHRVAAALVVYVPTYADLDRAVVLYLLLNPVELHTPERFVQGGGAVGLKVGL